MPKACQTYHREQIIALSSMNEICDGGSSFHRPYSVTVCVIAHVPCTTICITLWSRTYDSWGLSDHNRFLARSNWIYHFILTFIYLKDVVIQEKNMTTNNCSTRCDYIQFIIQGVPLATEPGTSLIILTPMKVLQRNLNRSTFIVWDTWHNNMCWKWPPFASRQDWTRRAIFWKVLASTSAVTAWISSVMFAFKASMVCG